MSTVKKMADRENVIDRNERGGSQPVRGRRRMQVGVVSSDKCDKTIRVVCRYMFKHRKYGKYINRRTVLHAHDEKNAAAVGDRVELMECRPMSKLKNWRLVRIVEKAR